MHSTCMSKQGIVKLLQANMIFFKFFTMHAHYAYIMYVQCMYSICTVYVLCIYCTYIVHTLCIHCAHTVHLLYVHCAYTVHSLYVRTLCIHFAYTVYILYIRYTYTIHSLYINYAYTIHVVDKTLALTSIGEWLDRLSLGIYENVLIANGFDNINMLVGDWLNFLVRRQLHVCTEKNCHFLLSISVIFSTKN